MLDNLKSNMEKYFNEYTEAVDLLKKMVKAVDNNKKLLPHVKTEEVAKLRKEHQQAMIEMAERYRPLLDTEVDSAIETVKNLMKPDANTIVADKATVDAMAEMKHSSEDALNIIRKFSNNYFMERYAVDKFDAKEKLQYYENLNGEDSLYELNLLSSMVNRVCGSQNPDSYSGRLLIWHGDGSKPDSTKAHLDKFEKKYKRADD